MASRMAWASATAASMSAWADPQLAAVQAAGVERRLQVQARPLLPAGNHVSARRYVPRRPGRRSAAGTRPGPLAGPPGRPPPLVGPGRPPGAGRRPVSRRSASARARAVQAPRSITSSGKPALRPMALFRRATASNSPSRARTRASRLSDSCTSARSTSSLQHHASLAPGLRVIQDRLGPADGVLLHPAGCAGQEGRPGKRRPRRTPRSGRPERAGGSAMRSRMTAWR